MKLEALNELQVRVRPSWRRSPTQGGKAVKLSTEDLCAVVDKYFEAQYDQGEAPTFCDLAGETGFDSITQLVNHARRKGGTAMRAVSRAFLAVGASYEDQAQMGSRNAIRMLEAMPQFDTEEAASQAPERPFQIAKDVNLKISGVVQREDVGSHMSPQQAYLEMIKHKTYEEIETVVSDTKALEGEYAEIEFEDDSNVVSGTTCP